MKEIISITELLNRIKKQKKKILDIDHKYLDENSKEFSSSKLLLTLYKPIDNTTINGVDINISKENIEKEFNEIINSIRILRNLLIIKEQVNSTFTMVVPNIFNSGKDINLSIAQILILKSPLIKNYYYKFINRCKNDIDIANLALEKHNENVLSNDNINRYVIAKFNSLHINIDPEYISDIEKIPNYEEFAKEYKSVNEVKIYDPLCITDKLEKISENAASFYDNIDTKLLEFNSTTKIVIDQEIGYWEKYE